MSWNLAFMTARMHHENLVVGDFSSNNVVVDRDGFCTFLDCDSIAFSDPASGEDFPCLMQTADYCSPERQKGAPATAASDDFALAVLISRLRAGAEDPAARPKAEDWLKALDQERTRAQVCPAWPRHTYGSHLTACPWYARAAATGQDPFNATPPPVVVSPPPQSQPTGRILAIVALVVFLTVLAVILAAAG